MSELTNLSIFHEETNIAISQLKLDSLYEAFSVGCLTLPNGKAVEMPNGFRLVGLCRDGDRKNAVYGIVDLSAIGYDA